MPEVSSGDVARDRMGSGKIPPNAREGRRLSVDPAVRTARTQLQLPSNLSFAEWQRVGKQLFLISDSSAWWLGDWLVFGEQNFPDRYRRAIAQTGLSYGTLRNYASVAHRFPVHRRHSKLSFHHHLEVASLPEAERWRWLEKAAEGGWSKSRLRAELRSSRDRADDEAPLAFRVQVTATQQQHELWQKAAERTQHDLVGWISHALDQAASLALNESTSAVSSDR